MTDIVFRNDSGEAVTTSMIVAEVFGKAHRRVLQDIDSLDCSDNFRVHHFVQMFSIRELPNGGSTKDRYYSITKNGFTILAMGYTGKKAMEFKERYIAAFDEMEKIIANSLQQSSSTSDHYLQSQNLIIQNQAQMIQQQAQLIQQQVELCNSLLQRMDSVLQVKPILEQQRTPIAIQPAQSQSVSMDLYPHEGVVSSYKTLRILHPDFVTVDRASQLLHERGVRIHKRSLYTYLEKEGHLSTEERTYHRPSRECVESGWMVCTSSGGTERYPRRKYHTPHLSPEFLDILEERLRNIRMEKLITHKS